MRQAITVIALAACLLLAAPATADNEPPFATVIQIKPIPGSQLCFERTTTVFYPYGAVTTVEIICSGGWF